MMKKYLLILLVLPLFVQGQTADYIDEEALFMKLVYQVQSPAFKFADYSKVYETVHLNRSRRKIDLKTVPAKKKVLSPKEIYKQNRPDVYRFVKVFVNPRNGKNTIDNISTAFPVSEEGHFLINHHMAELWEVGSGDSSKVDRSVVYFLADYDGNMFSIDSVCTYDKKSDVAIIKANTGGKKIKAFPLGEDLETGEHAYIIAHPKAYLYYFSEGMVNRMTQDGDDVYSRKMELSADYAGGSSGGPIFDNKGNIIGMVSQTLSFYYYQEEQKSLQMVVRQSVPVSLIKEFIKK